MSKLNTAVFKLQALLVHCLSGNTGVSLPSSSSYLAWPGITSSPSYNPIRISERMKRICSFTATRHFLNKFPPLSGQISHLRSTDIYYVQHVCNLELTRVAGAATASGRAGSQGPRDAFPPNATRRLRHRHSSTSRSAIRPFLAPHACRLWRHSQRDYSLPCALKTDWFLLLPKYP